jgi:hypothetical protein
MRYGLKLKPKKNGVLTNKGGLRSEEAVYSHFIGPCYHRSRNFIAGYW